MYFLQNIFILVCIISVIFYLNFYNGGKTTISNIETKNDSKTLPESLRNISFTTRSPISTLKISKQLWFEQYQKLESFVNKTGWPLVMMYSTGRLGNNLHNYALGIILQKMFPNIVVTSTEVTYNYVKKVIDNRVLTLPAISWNLSSNNLPQNLILALQPNTKVRDVGSYVLPSILSTIGKKIIILMEAYDTNIFAGHEEFLYQNLKVDQPLTVQANMFLKEVSLKHKQRFTFQNFTPIGIHIRRKNYQRFAETLYSIPRLPGKQYIDRAIKLYMDHIENPAFIVCSDDMKYAIKKFSNYSNVYFSNNTNDWEDFSLLAACSHSIMTMGSFGFWASFLAGGTVIYPDIKYTSNQHYGPSKQAFPNFYPISVNLFTI